MATEYRYFGIFKYDRDERPSSLFRLWTGPDGRENEEVFTRDLEWATSYWTSSLSRPDFHDDE